MLVNLQCINLSKVVVSPDKPACSRNSLHSLVECQNLNGLSFVKAPPLSGGSQCHEMIGAVEYRNDIFSMDY